MEYYAHNEMDAVIREDENGRCFAKLWECVPKTIYGEYEIGRDGDMRRGNPDYQSLPYEITKEEYDTFGKTWIFGSESYSKIPL
jgi:hypothetical protein